MIRLTKKHVFGYASSIFGLFMAFTKTLADWVGRIKLPEDLVSLEPMVNSVFEFSAEQPALLFYGVAFAMIGVGLFLIVSNRDPGLASSKPSDNQSLNASRGGDGGNSFVGGKGTSIGGQGGHTYGKSAGLRGGNGGGAKVDGDGIAMGGYGGSVTDGSVLPPPARNPMYYEARKAGVTVPPMLAEAGRGGAVPGYFEMLEFLRMHLQAEDERTELNLAFPPSDIVERSNQVLEREGSEWRVRLTDYQIEFFKPT